MKGKTSDFIKWLESKVGSPYLWGGQGETLYGIITKYAKTKDQSDSATKDMIKFMGIKDVEFFDCSGLGVDYMLKNGLISYDTTADGLYRKCDKISKEEAVPGDFVFLFNGSGKATHVGYVVENGYVVHALNQKVGVIKEKLSKRKWVYGRPNFAFEFDTAGVEYYPVFTGTSESIAYIMKSYGEDSSFAYRTKVAYANGIKNDYKGTAAQNLSLVKLAKEGKLVRP